MSTTTLSVQGLFQRSLSAHLSQTDFAKLQRTCVLAAGLGGGSNIVELLARKGIGQVILADPDVFEPHNIRQRGSALSTIGKSKTQVMAHRLQDIQPNMTITTVSEGITLENVASLVQQADYILDMIDFSALAEKVALYRAAQADGKFVITAPSVVNGAVLYVFPPDSVTFETFFDYEEGLPMQTLGPRVLDRLIPRYPAEAPRPMYEAAARGERTLPLDAVGVDQAAVLAVAAIENLILGRLDRVVMIPKGLHVDVSNPSYLGQVIDYSLDFRS